jgi:hypothetical protein
MKKIDAINFFGSQAKLADALQITRQAVNLWPDEVPLGRAYQLQVLTRGKLKARSKAV